MKIAGGIFGIIGVVLFGLGVMLCGLAGYLFVREQHFLQRAELATAVVTDNKLYTYTGQVNEYGVQHYYCSEFQFPTRTGRNVSFEETDCAQLDSPPDYQIGQKVEIYFDPQDPAKTVQMQKDRSSNGTAVVAATVAGALFVLVGLGIFWFDLWMNRKAAASSAGR